MSENIENDYDINLKIDEKLYHYKSVKKTNIFLNGHIELPQNYKFIMPRLSDKGIYVTAIGKAKNPKDDDVVFFWKAKHLNKKPILRLYGTSKIEFVQFFPDEKTFFVIYENKPPEIYDFEKVIRKCESIEPKNKKVCNYSFSKKGDRLAVASDKDFVVYNVNTGKIYLQILDDSKIKICRGKMIVLINDDFQIKIIEIIKWNKNQPETDDNKDNNEAYFKNRYKIIKKFNLTPGGIDNIIASKISPDKNYIYLITKEGISRITIDTQEMFNLQKQETLIINGKISDDCNIFMTTDMTTIKFWDYEKFEDIGTINKEKFDSFSINFSQCKLLTSDDICIDITDIMSNLSQQKYIWLDLNPTQFTSFSFSPDYKVLLAIIDEYSAIAYNCSSGEVIKKWKINLPNWSRACQMVPETSSIGVIATKSYNKIIKIWDYLTGTDLSTYKNFDVNNFSFSRYGNFLAAGTTEGEEIVHAWNLKTTDEYSLFYKKEDNETKNKNTFVKIYSENNIDIKGSKREDAIESLLIIAVAEDQNPLIFNLKQQQLIRECEGCPIQLSYIYDVQSQELFNLFYIHGKCINNIPTAILFDHEGEMLEEFENCKKIEFSPSTKCLLNYSDDIKQNIMSIIHLNEQNEINRVECQNSEINSKFLSDGKSILSIKDIDDEKKKIYIIEVTNGELIAEFDFVKKTDNFIALFFNLEEKTNCIIFRFIKLNKPKEV